VTPDNIQILGTTLFALSVLHTFSIKIFQHLALKFPEGSIPENLFHLLGEVEIVFGLWAAVLVAGIALLSGSHHAIQHVENTNFGEPIFVFAIMSVAATRPVLDFANALIRNIARLLPLTPEIGRYLIALTIGPLLGSFITEPAAMTVTALLLRERFFSRPLTVKLRYATLGVLFVNVSIGGVLTPYAAPPVLMVATTWGWDAIHMIAHFGIKAAVAVFLNACLLVVVFYRELRRLTTTPLASQQEVSPLWLRGLHLLFLTLIVLTSHHTTVFVGIFLFFLGLCSITQKFQDRLKLRESLLVAFFLGGLVVFGSLQRWWLEALIQRLEMFPLFLGATVLTAFTDNAALTYLGAQIPQISEPLKYALVAGAVAGGGLSVIANAPNPAGFSILRDSFGREGISPAGLTLGAAIPTLIAMACLWWLPSL
jgi:hypothetical protein